jgi:hypothetical protein
MLSPSSDLYEFLPLVAAIVQGLGNLHNLRTRETLIADQCKRNRSATATPAALLGRDGSRVTAGRAAGRSLA